MKSMMRWVRLSTAILGLCAARRNFAATIEDDFASPPAAAKPYVWWHWMSDNVSEAGIDKDLDAIRACGVGGVTVCDVGSTTGIGHTELGNSPFKVDFLGDKWWQLMQHAVQRGGELGLDMGMHNCGGWSASGGPWITPELSMQSLVWTKTHIDGPTDFDRRLDQPQAQLNFYKDIAVVAVPDKGGPPQAIELTDKLDTAGQLKWSAPAGGWTIYRFGHTSSAKTMHPMPDRFDGLEADKLSARAAEVHLTHVIDDAKQHLGSSFGSAFKHILFDSYEAKEQTWTADFRAQFKKRRGYDPLPYLPLMDNPNAYDGNTAARFQYDAARTTAELFLENDFQVYHKMLKAAGITMCLEPYKGPFDPISCTAACDVPMGEFWTFEKKRTNRNIVAAARALGRPIIGAEAFTGRPTDSQWNDDPAFLKPFADRALCDGVNQFYLHEWTLQPFDDSIVPGMTCGWWGTHFGRNQTWFEPGKAFFAYLARCSAVLQHGQPVIDYCTLGVEDDTGDTINEAMLQDCKVRAGQLVTATGRSYELLALPPKNQAMLPETARKLRQLVNDGATVLGPRPTSSPSLSDCPKCDEQVTTIAKEVWGDAAATAGPRRYGRGFVFTNLSPSEVLKAKSIEPDFQVAAAGAPLNFVHHLDGERDIYFVSNPTSQPVDESAAFRVAGKKPQLLDPVSGQSFGALHWAQHEKLTDVTLKLAANGSMFVVFSPSDLKQAPPSAGAGLASEKTIGIDGKWTVHFMPGRGAPESITLEKLQSWSDASDAGVKYFSGTGTYTIDFQAGADPFGKGRRALLDLGKVKSAAMVKLNGHDLGAVWCPTNGLDVTDALVVGNNHLEVAVSNTWKNRLIGDEQQPADVQWGTVQIFNRLFPSGAPVMKFPDWLVSHTPRPSKNRVTFTTWNYFDAKSKLDEAGLLGPVVLKSGD